MSAEQRRRVQLSALAAVALIAAWQFLGRSTPAEQVAAAARRAARAATPPPPADVRLDDLVRPDGSAGEATRNPFVFGARPAPAPASSAAPPAPAPTAPVVFAPAGPPPPPPIQLKFIGLVEGASGARIAVLSDTHGLVVHGSEGAIIDGRFKILSIGAESIDIAYADGRGRQTLRLTGQ